MFFTFKNFFNKVSNDNRIFTREDIKNMSSKEFSKQEKAIDYQMMNLGIPKNSELMGRDDVVYVHEYLRGDGTVVRAHYRSKPDGIAGNSHPDASEKRKIKNIVDYHMTTLSIGSTPFHAAVNKLYNEIHYNYPDAKKLAELFLDGPENAPKSDEYQYFTKGSGRVLNETYKLTGEAAIPDSWPGIIFNEHSSLSRNLSNSPTLKNAVKTNYNPLIGGFNTDRIEVKFENNEPNLFLALHSVLVFNPKVKNGYFTGLVFDKYDFKWNNKLDEGWKDRTNYANDAFYLIQKGRNYFLLVPVFFKL